jgi:hypothetical protein
MTAGPQARDRCGPADSGQGGEFGQLHCHLATQCRSNPVSGPGLPKTGIFQISAGDYRRFRSHSGRFRSPETTSRFAKARHWRAFLSLLRAKSPGAGLAGWRRSADRTCLHTNSLLTGNFTGNFSILRLSGPILLQQTAAPQSLLEQFPTQSNRENISKNREFLVVNREFHLQKSKKSRGLQTPSDLLSS